MKSLLRAGLIVTMAAAATARAAEPAPKGDLAKLQGTWTMTGGPNKDVEIAITIKDRQVSFVISRDGQEHASEGELKIDETAKPHKTLDWLKFVAPNGNDVPDNLSIYEFLSANELKLCSGGAGNERPTEFTKGENGPPSLVVLKRAKDKDKPAVAAAVKGTGDLAKLQGKWSGMAGPQKNVPISLTIKGQAVTVSFTGRDGQARDLAGEVKVDETAKPYKTLDLVKFTRLDGEQAPENPGIYQLDGDTLKVCSGGPGNDRPTEMKQGEGGPPSLIVFTREKN